MVDSGTGTTTSHFQNFEQRNVPCDFVQFHYYGVLSNHYLSDTGMHKNLSVSFNYAKVGAH